MKETLISELDKIEMTPPVQQDKVTTKQIRNQKNTGIIKPTDTIKNKLFSENNIALFILLSIAFHPVINGYINSTFNMGGVTFLIKALAICVIFFVYIEYM